jgi:transcription-repair coupling factor (superfamily II helicase)
MARRLISALKKGEFPIRLLGVRGSFKAFLLCQIEKEIKDPIVVVTASPTEAETIADDLLCLTGRSENSLLGSERGIHLFPAWETLPFETASPYSPIQGRRLEILFNLLAGSAPPIIVLSIRSLMQRVVPRSYLEKMALTVKLDQKISPEAISQRLLDGGFASMSICEEKGDFSHRGGVLDLFPPLYQNPIRFEFFGDQIDSIRLFDPQTQRSLDASEEVTILPIKEIAWSQEARNGALRKISEKGIGGSMAGVMSASEGIEQGVGFAGIEFLLPYFHTHLETLFDYLKGRAVLVIDSPFELYQKAEEFWGEIEERRERADEDGRPYARESELYMPPEEIHSQIERHSRIFFSEFETIAEEKSSAASSLRFSIELNDDLRREMLQKPHDEGIFVHLAERLLQWQEEAMEVHFFSATRGHAERLKELIDDYGIILEWDEGGNWGEQTRSREYRQSSCRLHVGKLSQGFRFHKGRIIFITDEDIFGPKRPQRTAKRSRKGAFVSGFDELKDKDLIVHVEHGVGIFRGLTRLDIEGGDGDFLLIEYLGRDRLYVPIYKLNMVQKYVGTEGFVPKLDKLGGTSWERRKKKTSEALRKMAKELLRVYAAREALGGFAFNKNDPYFDEFEKAFEYEETPDQMSAIDEVLSDMGQNKPMDRLICGDVGYGKTEVALRAAFKAVMHGKQVAVLVPTTVLAQQHYQTFADRFMGYPVFIEVLSRFKKPREQREILKRCAKGEVDILIGTHRLIQKDVAFKNLGLMVIDEEHRFGVSHKERLKKISKLIDVITMTATPIPRTLYMSFSGIRDLSIINTPPPNRLSIRTHISPFDRRTIEEALLREIQRGGQVFFVHNRVQSIMGMARTLQKWIPGVRIAVGHGQLPEKELERVMSEFVQRKFDVLVCTTIIQSGLDIPNANTIIINHADKLGLAEMYQIRGRVGRSGHQAYAYLLIPRGLKTLSEEARKRLQVLQEFSELGAGFKIATRDLEIRGAGTLLGPSQSGNIDGVGFEMYTQLMKRAVAELKGEPLPKEIEPEIRIPVSAYLPAEYIKDSDQRLLLYKKISSVGTEDELMEIQGEIEDRYGKVPGEAKNLLKVIMIKTLLRDMGIRSLRWYPGGIELAFDEEAPVDTGALVRMVQEGENHFRLSPDARLSISISGTPDESLFEEITKPLKDLERKIKIAN